MDILKFIPSIDVKKYCKSYSFLDYEKAILIYHLDMLYRKKCYLLIELYHTTDDIRLKEQIKNFLEIKKSDLWWTTECTDFLNDYIFIPHPFCDGDRVQYRYGSEQNVGVIQTPPFEGDFKTWADEICRSGDWNETKCRIVIDSERNVCVYISPIFIEYIKE